MVLINVLKWLFKEICKIKLFQKLYPNYKIHLVLLILLIKENKINKKILEIKNSEKHNLSI